MEAEGAEAEVVEAGEAATGEAAGESAGESVGEGVLRRDAIGTRVNVNNIDEAIPVGVRRTVSV